MRLCIAAQTDEGLNAPRCRSFRQASFFAFVEIGPDGSFELAGIARGADAVRDAEVVLVADIDAASLQALKTAGLRVYQDLASRTVEAGARAYVGGRATDL